MQAAGLQGQNNLDIFNSNQAQQQGALAGGASLGLLALALSDRRLKTDIEFLGEMKGRKFYRFRYLWDKVKQIGVMADENPDIAVEGPHGYMMVNYGRL